MAISDVYVRGALKGQYHAALAMLREAVELCSDESWLDETRPMESPARLR